MRPCRLPALRGIRCCHRGLQLEPRLTARISSRPPPYLRGRRLAQHRHAFHSHCPLGSGLFRPVFAAVWGPSSPTPASLSHSQQPLPPAPSAPSAASAAASAAASSSSSAFLDPDFPRVPLATNSSYRAAASQPSPAQAADDAPSALSPAPTAAAASSFSPSSEQPPQSSRPRRAANWAQTLRWRFFKARGRLRARANAERWDSQGQPAAAAAGQGSAVLCLPHASLADLCTFTVADSVRHILNPSLVSRISDMPFSTQLLLRWRRILYSLLPLGGSSFGNRVTVYSDGDEAFSAMWAAIAAAQRSIRMETYILSPDHVGIRTMQLLAEAARRGVKVTLIYDSVGSSALLTDWRHLAELTDSGAEVVQFNPLLSWPWRRSLLFRNHRKLLVVDDSIAFTGGMNVGDEYCGRKLGGTAQFRDTHLKVEGPAVFDLIAVFHESYSEALPNSAPPVYASRDDYRAIRQGRRRETLSRLEGRVYSRAKDLMRRVARGPAPITPVTADSVAAAATAASSLSSSSVSSSSFSPSSSASDSVTSYWPAPPPPPSSHSLFVQVLSSNLFRSSRRLIQRAMIITLQNARHRAFITTPYFIPPARLLSPILSAPARGVDVRLLTAGHDSDVPWSRWASMHIYHRLLSRGIRVYELQGRMLHAKTVCIDGLYASVGSFNFDRMSVLNLELNLTVLDVEVVQQLEAQFFIDLQHCTEVRQQDMHSRTLPERLLHWICYRIALLIA